MWSYLNRTISFLESVLAIALLMSTTVVLFTNIVLRYFFGKGLTWAEEFIAYAMIWATFLGAAICVRKKAHVAMSLVFDSIKSKYGKKIYEGALLIIAIGFCALFIVLGIQEAAFLKQMGQTSPAMRLPMYIPYLAVPFGFTLMLVRFIEQFMHLIKPAASGGEK